MDNESDFDFNTLTKAQLEHSIEQIDGTKFPKNLADARAALSARNLKETPEPATAIDAATDRRFMAVVEKILALIIVAWAIAGVWNDDLWVPIWSHFRGLRIFHLHGNSAYIGAAGLVIFAVIPFLNGITDQGGPKILPKFRPIFLAACAAVLIAMAVSVLSGRI